MTREKGGSPELIVSEIKRLSTGVSRIFMKDGIYNLRN